MSYALSLLTQGTLTLRIGLSLYWESVRFTTCALATAFWAQCGSSLFEPALPDYISPPSP